MNCSGCSPNSALTELPRRFQTCAGCESGKICKGLAIVEDST